MHIVASKKDLQRILDRCHTVADKKAALPALSNVLLTAEGRALKIAATDLYIGVSGSIDVQIERGGGICLPAKDLFERVKAMPDGNVEIIADKESRAIVKAVGTARKFNLHGLPAGDFPQLPAAKPDAFETSMPAQEFAACLNLTHFSIADDETRAHVNSLLFRWRAGRLTVVSTDGHRMSKFERPHDPKDHEMLISKKAIGTLRGALDKGDVHIVRSGPTAFFSIDGLTMSVKIVDAQFPPWEQVIPARTEFVKIPLRAFLDAVKAVQLAVDARKAGVRLSLIPGALKITAESPDAGAAADEIPLDYNGPEQEVGVNPKYLIDVCEAIDKQWGPDEFDMSINGGLEPLLLTAGAIAGEQDCRFVIMPMR